MRSIRLSLLVYFLVLVSASLGVASLFVYTVARRTLRDKEEAAATLIDARYEERRREAEALLDERLLSHAKVLAGRVRPESRWGWIYRDRDKRYFHLAALGLLTSRAGPNAFATSPFWLAQGVLTRGEPPRDGPGPRSPRMPLHSTQLQQQLFSRNQIVLKIGKEVTLPEDAEGPRIHSVIETNHWGPPLRLSGDLRLPSEADWAPDKQLWWEFDNCILPEGAPLRRVRFRAKMSLDMQATFQAFRPKFIPAPAALIIQCAADHRELDTTLEGFRQQRDEERQQLRAETAAALAFQRNWLLIIIGCTFAATILGCVGLVWLGLRPMSRLSDAVSKITPKNFTLALGDKRLPVELQPVAERLNETLDQLRRAFAREKQATADISHELRTPLAALITTIELALRKPRSPEQYRELLQDSHDSAKQMHKIVERLLTLARLDAGVDRLRAHSIDVAELAEQCALAVRPLAEARGLQLAVHNQCDADPATAASRVSTDPDKLREILSNLLHNAIQYNRPAGKIDLVVARDNGHVRLEVRDTGIGIPAETRERIFERFFRVDPSRTTDGLNAGLGLAIVKEYIELMGGHIRVESALGHGSTFRVDLPMQAPTSAA
jgi:heavy metal sensor kinase